MSLLPARQTNGGKMVLYAFDVDQTLWLSGGPIKLADLMELRNSGPSAAERIRIRTRRFISKRSLAVDRSVDQGAEFALRVTSLPTASVDR